MKLRYALLCAGAVLTATSANATTCEESFARSGNALSSTTFTATQTVNDLSVADAVAQMHGIVVAGNYDILQEDRDGGSMLLEQRATSTRRAIPVLIAVTRNGATTDIAMNIRLPTGVFAGSNGVRTEMCNVLGQLRGGAEGRRLAAQGGATRATNAPTVIQATSLSNEIARAHTVNPAVIPVRYRERSWTVSGRLANVERIGSGWIVTYDIPPPILSGPLTGPDFSILLTCSLSSNQSAWALTLRRGQAIRLTGAFDGYDEGRRHLMLTNCVNTPR